MRRSTTYCLCIVAAGLLAGAAPISAEPVALHRTAHFELAHDADGAFAAELGVLLEELYARHLIAARKAGLLPHAPAGVFRWVCVEHADALQPFRVEGEGWEQFNRQAFYASREDRVLFARDAGHPVADDWTAVPAAAHTRCLSHELAHQVAYRSGLQRSGVMYAFWISEGLALNFETVDARKGGFAGENAPRRERLIEAHREGRIADLFDFIAMPVRRSPQMHQAIP